MGVGGGGGGGRLLFKGHRTQLSSTKHTLNLLVKTKKKNGGGP